MSSAATLEAPERTAEYAEAETLELSIVMPCLNEAETLETCIRKARGFLERHGVRGEIVIGDNGSTDGSQDIARRCGARVVDVKLRGYGAALYHATLVARGQYVIMGDSDDSYDFSDLMPLLKELRAGRDLVMGNRFAGGIKPGAMPWKNRYLGNPVLSGLGRLFFRCPVRDFHCGLRGYSADAFRRMDLQTTGMEFASEMVIRATLLGMEVVEAPTTLSPDGRSRPPHLRPWRDGWRHLRFMLLYSPRWLFLYPGLLLMLVGLGVGAWLLPQPRQVGGTEFDVHTLLYAAAAVLLGFQTCMFALLARAVAASRKLLPDHPLVDRILRHSSLEAGLLVGLGLIAAGVAGSAAAVWWWESQSFGPLDPRIILRIAIPSVLALLVGSEVVLCSFLLGVIRLPTQTWKK